MMPAAGTSTTTEAVSPAAATAFVPSAKVTSWPIVPLLVSLTSYFPALATITWGCS